MFDSYFFFFFSSRRRHTRLTCDWSSDVCSSDLGNWASQGVQLVSKLVTAAVLFFGAQAVIGRASCRERGVDLGGRRIIKKKKKQKNKSHPNKKRIKHNTCNTVLI